MLVIKAKINKWDLIEIKSFCTTKETISKVKRQPSELDKIIANEATDKESQNYTSNSRKISDPIKKWAKPSSLMSPIRQVDSLSLCHLKSSMF